MQSELHGSVPEEGQKRNDSEARDARPEAGEATEAPEHWLGQSHGRVDRQRRERHCRRRQKVRMGLHPQAGTAGRTHIGACRINCLKPLTNTPYTHCSPRCGRPCDKIELFLNYLKAVRFLYRRLATSTYDFSATTSSTSLGGAPRALAKEAEKATSPMQ